MAIVVTFNAPALRSIAIAGAAGDIRQRANRVQSAARAGVPVDTGRLRSSIHTEFFEQPDGSPAARIGSDLDHAIFVHEGTGLYGPRGTMIYPKNGKYMVWPAVNNSGSGTRRYSGGRTLAYVFAKQTRGMPGTPYLLDALEAAR